MRGLVTWIALGLVAVCACNGGRSYGGPQHDDAGADDRGDAGPESNTGFPQRLDVTVSFLLEANQHVYRVGPGLKQPELLIAETTVPAQLSPTAGHALVFGQRIGQYLVDLTTWDVAPLPDVGKFLSFSPSGDRILYGSISGNYHVLNLTERADRVVARTVDPLGATWSPTGRYLALTYSGMRAETYLLDLESEQGQLITNDEVNQMLFSPGEESLALSTLVDGGATVLVHDIAKLETNSYVLGKDIAVGRLQSFSQDGRWLYVSAAQPGKPADRLLRLSLADQSVNAFPDARVLEVDGVGRWAVVQDADGISLLSLDDGKVETALDLSLSADIKYQPAFSFSPNKDRLAFGSPLTVRDLVKGVERVPSTKQASAHLWANEDTLVWTSYESPFDKGAATGGQVFVTNAASTDTVALGKARGAFDSLELVGVAPNGRALCEHRRVRVASTLKAAIREQPEEQLLLWTSSGGASPKWSATVIQSGAPNGPLRCVFPPATTKR
jgi:hypothetical protein